MFYLNEYKVRSVLWYSDIFFLKKDTNIKIPYFQFFCFFSSSCYLTMNIFQFIELKKDCIANDALQQIFNKEYNLVLKNYTGIKLAIGIA